MIQVSWRLNLRRNENRLLNLISNFAVKVKNKIDFKIIHKYLKLSCILIISYTESMTALQLISQRLE